MPGIGNTLHQRISGFIPNFILLYFIQTLAQKGTVTHLVTRTDRFFLYKAVFRNQTVISQNRSYYTLIPDHRFVDSQAICFGILMFFFKCLYNRRII